jgi:hypothetical protein
MSAIGLIWRTQDMTNKIIHRMLSTVLLIPMPAPFSGGKEKEQARPVAPLEGEVNATISV